jgi:hypothetical protein
MNQTDGQRSVAHLYELFDLNLWVFPTWSEQGTQEVSVIFIHFPVFVCINPPAPAAISFITGSVQSAGKVSGKQLLKLATGRQGISRSKGVIIQSLADYINHTSRIRPVQRWLPQRNRAPGF